MSSCCCLLLVLFVPMRMDGQQKLDTVKVSAEAPPDYRSPLLRGFEERRAKGMGKFISEKELRAGDNRTLPNVLTKLPGVRLRYEHSSTFVVASRSGAKGGRGMTGSPCYVAVYQDGMRLYGGGGGGGGAPEQPMDFQRLQVREYAGIEFYPGGASMPVEFNQTKGSDCGTLLLWTRER